MKKLLFFVFFAGGLLSASAQLFVRPNPSTNTDSYVYVNDVELYVDDEVNLQLNTNNAATEASIYLRGDAQLIQGQTTSANQGNGLLSVYQQGFADRWEYNYWASPVGNASASLGNENFGLAKLYDVDTATNSIQALTTPGYDGSSTPLTISTRWVWKFLAGTSYSDWVFVGASQNVAPGQGFTMKGVDIGADLASTPRQEYDFRGKPNSGDISNAVLMDQLTLIGNPYPSAVDMDAFLSGNPDIEQSIFYWEQDHTTNSHFLRDYEGGYGQWIAGGGGPEGTYFEPIFYNYEGDGSQGPPAGGATGTTVQRRYAPIGQGFMVRGDVDGTVTMRDAYRVFVTEGAANLSEFKSGEMGSDTKSGDTDLPLEPRWPQVKINTFINDLYSSPLLLMFHKDATLGMDPGMDSSSPRNLDNDVYWNLEGEADDHEFTIQTLPLRKDAMIPITFKVGEISDFRLYVLEKTNFKLPMYVYDAQFDAYQILNDKDYVTFKDLEPGVYKDRFYITFMKFENPAEAELDKMTTQVQVFQNNPAKQLEVLNDELLMLESATLYDINGRQIWSRNDLGNDARYYYPTGLLADGVYLLRLKTTDGAIKTEKVMILNR